MNVGFVNQNVSPRLNMGLAYVMTCVARRHRVVLWDIVGRPRKFSEYLKDGIRRHRPGVIGFSVNNFTFQSAIQWASVIKREFPEIILIFGGVYPTLMPEECLQHPLVDVICIGEGEESFLACVDAFDKNASLTGIAGVWYKDNDGTMIRNPPRPFISNLDALPFPDWNLWDIDLYVNQGELLRNSLKVLASRGCFYSCTFCTIPIVGRKIPGTYYRVRSAVNVVDEIEHQLRQYGQRGFRILNFADSLFGADQEQFEAFTALYRQRGLHQALPWVCETRPEVVTRDWARKAKTAGCLVVSLGVESMNDGVRQKTLGKATTTRQITGAVSNLREQNILYILYFILCAPGETFRSLWQTIAFGFSSAAIKTYFLFYLPLPHTALGEENKQQQKEHRDSRHDDGHWNNPNIGLGSRQWIWPFMAMVLTLAKIVVFLARGLTLRGTRFLADVAAYLGGKARVLPMRNPYAQNELYQNTVLKYYIEDAMKRRST